METVRDVVHQGERTTPGGNLGSSRRSSRGRGAGNWGRGAGNWGQKGCDQPRRCPDRTENDLEFLIMLISAPRKLSNGRAPVRPARWKNYAAPVTRTLHGEGFGRPLRFPRPAPRRAGPTLGRPARQPPLWRRGPILWRCQRLRCGVLAQHHAARKVTESPRMS